MTNQKIMGLLTRRELLKRCVAVGAIAVAGPGLIAAPNAAWALEVASRLPDARARVRILGITDRFVDHMTSRDEQLATFGLDAEGIEKSCRTTLRASLVSPDPS